MDDNLRKEFEQIKPEYEKLVSKRGSIIREIIKIERQEESHYVLEDADFSLSTIKKLIKEGQADCEKTLD